MEKRLDDALEKLEVKRSIDAALAVAAKVEHESDSVVTREYVDALHRLFMALSTNKISIDTKDLTKVVLDSNMLIGENASLRKRLKDSVEMIVSSALTGGRVSLCGR
jgi:hypothetical protein